MGTSKKQSKDPYKMRKTGDEEGLRHYEKV